METEETEEEFCPFTTCTFEGCKILVGQTCNCGDCPSCDGLHQFLSEPIALNKRKSVVPNPAMNYAEEGLYER